MKTRAEKESERVAEDYRAADRFPLKSIFAPTENNQDVFRCMPCKESSSCPCPIHTTFVADEDHIPRALATCPRQLYIGKVPRSQETGVFTRCRVKSPMVFGPLTGKLSMLRDKATENQYSVTKMDHGTRFYYRLDSDDTSNWMKYVRRADSNEEGNVVAFQREEQVYFAITGPLLVGTELRLRRMDDTLPRSAENFSRTRISFSVEDVAPSVPELHSCAKADGLQETGVDPDSVDIPDYDVARAPLYNFLPEAEEPPQTSVAASSTSEILCSRCGDNLVTNVASTAGRGRPWRCGICGQQHLHKLSAQKHISKCHENRRCQACQRTPAVRTAPAATTGITTDISLDAFDYSPSTSILSPDITDEPFSPTENELVCQPQPPAKPAALVLGKTRAPSTREHALLNFIELIQLNKLANLLPKPSTSQQHAPKKPAVRTPKTDSRSKIPNVISIFPSISDVSNGTYLFLPKLTEEPVPTRVTTKKRPSSAERSEPSKKPPPRFIILNTAKSTEEVLLQAVLEANPYQYGRRSLQAIKAWRAVYSRLLDSEAVIIHSARVGAVKLRLFIRSLVRRYDTRIKNRSLTQPADATAVEVSQTDALLQRLSNLMRQQAATDAEQQALKPTEFPCVYCTLSFPNEHRLKKHKQREHFTTKDGKMTPGQRRDCLPLNGALCGRRRPQQLTKRYTLEILQAVVAAHPYDTFPNSATANKAWISAYEGLVAAGHYKSASVLKLAVSDLRKFVRRLVDRFINSPPAGPATAADEPIHELLQQIYEMMQNQPLGGYARDVLTEEFVEERLQVVVDNNPYQFRRFTGISRTAWEDVHEELVFAGYLRPSPNVSLDCWKLRSFVQRHVEEYRAEVTAGTADPDSRKSQLLQRISDFMRIPPSLQPQQEEFVVEKLQAVADANPYRFLDPNSARAVWTSIYEGLVALNCMLEDAESGWRNLRAFARRVVVPLGWTGPPGVDVASRKDQLIKKIYAQVRQREMDQMAQKGLPGVLCLKCVRKYDTEEELKLHDQDAHVLVPGVGGAPGSGPKHRKRPFKARKRKEPNADTASA